MATFIGRSGAGDDLIRRLHDEGVSRSCTTIRQVMERKEAIDRAIEHERRRQHELLDREVRELQARARRGDLVDALLFFGRRGRGEEHHGRLAHLRANREAIVENNLLYLYREKEVLDRLTWEYRSELKGYYGELLVMDALRKLGDDYFVISDVRITRASGHRFDGRMLKAARIDHIVVGSKGVYCIETKHWNSIKRTDDKPTPGGQARRASHLLYKYLKYTCGIGGVKVMGIVLYTNTTIKGKEDFVRFMRHDEFPGYLAARPENIPAEIVIRIVQCLGGRDILFDDAGGDRISAEAAGDAEAAPAPEVAEAAAAALAEAEEGPGEMAEDYEAEPEAEPSDDVIGPDDEEMTEEIT